MFNLRFTISISIFIIFLIITSVVKNKTRLLEKKILGLNSKIFLKEKNLSETQLEFSYLTSPREIEKKLEIYNLKKFKPVESSKIFYNLNELIILEKKMTNLININEKKNKKK